MYQRFGRFALSTHYFRGYNTLATATLACLYPNSACSTRTPFGFKFPQSQQQRHLSLSPVNYVSPLKLSLQPRKISSMKQQRDIASFFGGMAKKGASKNSTKQPETDTPEESPKSAAEPSGSDDASMSEASEAENAVRSPKQESTRTKRRIVDSDSDAEMTEAKPAKASRSGKSSKAASGASSPSSEKQTKKQTKKKPAQPNGLAPIKNGDMVPFLELCKVLEAIEGVSGRLDITAKLKDFLVSVMAAGEEQLSHVVMLCMAKVAPDYEGIELGIGESILLKAIATATGRQLPKVREDHRKLGDLGAVVVASKSNQRTMFKPKPLTVTKVFTSFKEIALTSGANTVQKKQSLIAGLLASCSDIEGKFLIRSLEGKLRIGLAESTVQTALAQAALVYEEGEDAELTPGDFQKATESLKQVLSEYPVYSSVISAMYKHGISNVHEHCMLTPMLPVKPMLAKIEKDAGDILGRFDGVAFTCEYKYDGERSQIHFSQEAEAEAEAAKCMIYSRNSENNTNKYMDIAGSAKEFANAGVTSFILDCEAVGWDLETGKILSFQTLSSRKRKVADESEIKVRVCCFVFDLLYLNGEALIRQPLRRRRELLRQHFTPVENKFQFAVSKDCSEVEDMQEFLEKSIEDNCEGLMIKSLDGDSASYEPSKRSLNWLKLKKDYVDGLGDSLDLVVVGAYYGKGKRVGAYGAYLLACYDPEREEYQTICKIGTGFSDADLEAHKTQLDQSRIEAPKSYYAYSDKTKPDVWFEPAQVWEVKAADLSLSPVYQAAFGEINASKGISLRFPRFLRVRDDKSPDEATSSSQVAEMYENQKING